jgi:hypothetical protein
MRDKKSDDPIILKHVKTVLQLRILEYRPAYFNTTAALALSEPLHNKLKDYVENNLSHIDISDHTYERNIMGLGLSP